MGLRRSSAGAPCRERGEQIFHLPGLALNRAREAQRGGEHKSDRNDAFVIADQLRMRWGSLQEICPKDEALAEMPALYGRHETSRLLKVAHYVLPVRIFIRSGQ